MNAASVRRAEMAVAEAGAAVELAMQWAAQLDVEGAGVRVSLEDVQTRLDRVARMLVDLRVESPERDDRSGHASSQERGYAQ